MIDASVGIVEPSGGLPEDNQRACYEDLQHRLVEAHCEFVTVETDILARGTLSSAGWSYRDITLEALVVPPMRDPEEELLRFLERFEYHSGFVARVGAERDCDVVARELTRRFPPVAIVSSRGASAEAGAVICARRRGPSDRWVFLVNTAPRGDGARLFPPLDSWLVPAQRNRGAAWRHPARPGSGHKGSLPCHPRRRQQLRSRLRPPWSSECEQSLTSPRVGAPVSRSGRGCRRLWL